MSNVSQPPVCPLSDVHLVDNNQQIAIVPFNQAVALHGGVVPDHRGNLQPSSNLNLVSDSPKIDRVPSPPNKRTYDDIGDLDWNIDDILHPKASQSVPQVSLANASLETPPRESVASVTLNESVQSYFPLPTRKLPCPKPLDIPQVRMPSNFSFKKVSQIPVTTSSLSLTSPTSSQFRLSSSASTTSTSSSQSSHQPRVTAYSPQSATTTWVSVS